MWREQKGRKSPLSGDVIARSVMKHKIKGQENNGFREIALKSTDGCKP